MEGDRNMAKVGDRFHTGQKCETTGSYAFDGYMDGTTTPSPTNEEREFRLTAGETFPPVRSTNKAAYWKLWRLG
jgi:hypothetical protein